MVWYPRKQKLNDGPNFPSTFTNYPGIGAGVKIHEFCTISLNRSHLMLVHAKNVFIIDFIKEKWTPLPTLNLDSISPYLIGCSGISGFDKNGNK